MLNIKIKPTVLLCYFFVGLMLCTIVNAQEAPSPQSAEEDFVSSVGNQIIMFIKEKNLSKQQQEQHFRDILQNSFSLKSIARFVLGRYWKQASPQEREEYNQLFEDVVIGNYVSQFGDYTNEKFTVESSYPSNMGGIMVKSKIYRPHKDPVAVTWFVRDVPGHGLRVFDLFVEGISLSITQRSEYAAIIRKHGGQIRGLLDEMQNQIKDYKTSKEPGQANT